MEIKYETVRAIVLRDAEHNVHTVFLEKEGGPIISAATEEEAKTRFVEALNLSCAVRNLRNFAQAVKTAVNRDRQNIDAIERTNPNIEYIVCNLQ